MKTGIFYGSATGVTEEVAKEIGAALGVESENIYNVAEIGPSKTGEFDLLLLGTSTWGNGELEDSWYDFIDGMQALDLKGKKIALFGCGDQTMSDTFCDGVGILYDKLRDSGAEFIAPYNAFGYEFDHSKAMIGEGPECVGLLLDQVNSPDLTADRIAKWTELVKKEAK